MSKVLKLWLVSQGVRTGYDTFDSFVVVSESEDQAKMYNPQGEIFPQKGWDYSYAWCDSPEQATVQYLGVATPREFVEGEVIISSFNAG